MNRSNIDILRAMFWKECRENAKWALLAALGLAFAILAGATQSNPGLQYSAKPFESFWSTVDSAMMIGCAVTALLLGLMQILPERRRDQWAFLLHRPASRSQLFWGKACAGLALYLLATLAPLCAVSLWAAIPGDMAAPFDPRLMLAGVAAIACGANMYFAALIVALRPARWYGSRGLPLLGGGALTFLSLAAAHEFWRTIALQAVVMAPLALAAWSSFIADNDESRRPIAGRIALTLTLFTSSVVLCLGIFALASLWGATHQGRTPLHVEEYAALDSGRIVKATYVDKANSTGGEAVVSEIRDLEGRLLNVDRDRIQPASSLGSGETRAASYASFMSPDRYVQPIVMRQTSSNPPLKAWFYSEARRRIVGYSLVTRRAVREIGPNGDAVAGSGGAAPFPGYLVEPPSGGPFTDGLCVFSRQIYRLNSATIDEAATPSDPGSVTPLLRQPLDDDIVSVTNSRFLVQRSEDLKGQDESVVVTAHGVSVIDHEGRTRFTAPLEKGWTVLATFLPEARGAAAPGGAGCRYLFWTWPNGVGGHGPQSGRVTEYSSTGRALRQESLPSLHPTDDRDWAYAAAYIAVIPLSSALFAAFGLDGLSRPGLVMLAFTFGVFWASLSWMIARRAALTSRQSAVGAMAGLLLGLPAAHTLLSLYRWPARVTCSSCGARRMITRELCERCGAAFPPAPSDGTEIFEQYLRVASTI